MLTDQDWDQIRAYTDEVVSRDRDSVVFHAGRVDREPHGITIRLDFLQVDLEPEVYNGTPQYRILTPKPGWPTSGPGWPE